MSRKATDKSKHHQLVSMLRDRIVAGTWHPGHRLPTRTQLQQQFDVACSTMQLALNQLSREGFVEAHGRRGTFVAQSPPHLSHLAIVFARSDADTSQFYAALSREADGFGPDGKRVSVFRGIDDHTDVEDYHQLLSIVRTRRLAGLVLAGHIGDLTESLLQENPHLPRVAIASGSRFSGMPLVFPDYRSFIGESVRCARARGRRRIAWIMSGPLHQGAAKLRNQFLDAVAEHGLETHPYWMHNISADVAGGARSLTHLMMNGQQGVRADAIVIADDNLVEPVTRGVLDAAVRLPDELTVVAHTNFPWPTPTHIPVVRIGFDVRQVLSTCVELIEAQRQSRPAPALSLVPALHEEEAASVADNRRHASLR